MAENNFYDEALIKLRRQYGKDELVAVLTKQLSQKDFEIGQLKSYIDELEDTLKKTQNTAKMELGNLLSNPQNLIDKHGFTYISLKKYNQMQNELKGLRGKVISLRNDNRYLIAKSISK